MYTKIQAVSGLRNIGLEALGLRKSLIYYYYYIT
jgi:hypothetical protein